MCSFLILQQQLFFEIFIFILKQNNFKFSFKNLLMNSENSYSKNDYSVLKEIVRKYIYNIPEIKNSLMSSLGLLTTGKFMLIQTSHYIMKITDAVKQNFLTTSFL